MIRFLSVRKKITMHGGYDMWFLGLLLVLMIIVASMGVYGYDTSMVLAHNLLDDLKEIPRGVLWRIWNYLDTVFIEKRIGGCIFSENVSARIIEILRSAGVENVSISVDDIIGLYCLLFRLAGYYEGGYVPKLRIDIYNCLLYTSPSPRDRG